MKKKNKYFLNKERKYLRYAAINLNTSYDIKKRLGESFEIIKFYNEEFITFAVKMSLDKQFKKLLEFIIETDEDGDSPSDLILCLNETDKIRKEIINKYAGLLDKKEKEFFKKKLAIIENDIKNKFIACQLNMMAFNEQENAIEDNIEVRHHR